MCNKFYKVNLVRLVIAFGSLFILLNILRFYINNNFLLINNISYEFNIKIRPSISELFQQIV